MAKKLKTETTKYVVGFVFSSDASAVVLIRKRRPEWQAGRFNGVGGSIEADEKPVDAMTREYAQEAGVQVAAARWIAIAELTGPGYTVYFYALFDDDVYKASQTKTDEEVSGYDVAGLHSEPRLLSPLHYLLPLCVHRGASDSGFKLTLPVQITEEPK